MKCGTCKQREAHHKHHKDGNHKNDNPENIQYLCTLCHAEIHDKSPKQSELKRLVIMRDRALKIRIALNNQIKGFSRIEYSIPKKWVKEKKKFDDEIKKLEKEIKKLLKENYKEITKWLDQIKGINFITIGKLISYIDIKNTPTVSALWRYCGLDATHIKRTRKISQKETLKFGNPYLKKELLGVLANILVMHNAPLYYNIYQREKEKQLEREYTKGFLKEKHNGYKKSDIHLTKGHAHNRAIRKMMKIFLEHFWVQWRTLENLPITKPYIIGKNGHKNYIKAKAQLKPMIKMRTILPMNPIENLKGVDD